MTDLTREQIEALMKASKEAHEMLWEGRTVLNYSDWRDGARASKAYQILANAITALQAPQFQPARALIVQANKALKGGYGAKNPHDDYCKTIDALDLWLAANL